MIAKTTYLYCARNVLGVTPISASRLTDSEGLPPTRFLRAVIRMSSSKVQGQQDAADINPGRAWRCDYSRAFSSETVGLPHPLLYLVQARTLDRRRRDSRHEKSEMVKGGVNDFCGTHVRYYYSTYTTVNE